MTPMRSHRFAPIVPLAIAALALAACQQLPSLTGGTSPAPAPQISEESLRDRAKDQLATGIKAYDAGEDDAAGEKPTRSLRPRALRKADPSPARQNLAFTPPGSRPAPH